MQMVQMCPKQAEDTPLASGSCQALYSSASVEGSGKHQWDSTPLVLSHCFLLRTGSGRKQTQLFPDGAGNTGMSLEPPEVPSRNQHPGGEIMGRGS